MLFLLDQPDLLLGLALSLLVAIVAHSVVQAYVATRLGDRWAAASGRTNPDPRRHFEPFGVVAMVISGIGWNKPVPLEEPRFRGARPRYLLAVLSGPVTNLLLAVVGAVGVRLTGEDFAAVGLGESTKLFVPTLLLQFAFVNAAVGVLTLVPLPPLDGARILWMYAPPTEGWRRARYHLEERNIGLGIVIVTILPLFGGMGLLNRIVYAVAIPFLEAVYGLLGMST